MIGIVAAKVGKVGELAWGGEMADRNDTRNNKSQRGFAAMDDEQQREIASKGGRAAHAKGTAHEFTPEEAREAGRKGGEAVSQDRSHMAEIGRKGGESGGSHSGSSSDQQAQAGRQSHRGR